MSPWTGSAVNAAVAQKMIEQSSVTRSRLIDIDEYAQFQALSNGDLDATLEVWPSGHAEDFAKYIERQKGRQHRRAGRGRQDRLVRPTYIIERAPRARHLGRLNGQRGPVRDGRNGQRARSSTGDPSYVRIDAEIVKNLGLDLEVVERRLRAAELAALDDGLSRDEPLLMYSVDAALGHAKYDLTEVDAARHAKSASRRDDETGEDRLRLPAGHAVQGVQQDLQTKAPAAFAFLSAMSYDNAAQEAIALSIDVDGMDPAGTPRRRGWTRTPTSGSRGSTRPLA